MANPNELQWTGPTAYVDKSPFGEADLAGFQILVDDQPAVAVPMAWNDANTYVFPLASLSLAFGEHTARIVTVAANGKVSAPSNAVTFTLNDERVPGAPLDLRVVGSTEG